MINKIRINLQHGMVRCRLIMVFVSAVFFLVSCDRSPSSFLSGGASVPLTVNQLALIGETPTRVTSGVVTTEGAAIGVFLTSQNGYKPVYNCAYKYSAAGGGWNSTTPIWVDGRQAKIVGVYDPNNVGVFPASNTSTVLSTKLTVQQYDETKVWYFDNANITVNNLNSTVAFKMKPAYSRMVLQIERGVSYKGDCKVTEVTLLSGGEFYNNLPLDVTTGTLLGTATAYNAATNAMLTKEEGFVTISSVTTSAQSIDLLLPPQAVQSSGMTLSIKVDGQVRSVQIPYASLPKLESAMQYIVSLKIIAGATVITNGTFTGEAWGATPTVVGTVTDKSGMN